MKNQHFIVSDIETERMIITKNYSKIYDFIVCSPNSKIRTIGLDIKPKILDRRKFLTSYLKNTINNNYYFELVKILIKEDYNRIKHLKETGLKDKYRYYMNNKNNVL